jgi:hypothetical protein
MNVLVVPPWRSRRYDPFLSSFKAGANCNL